MKEDFQECSFESRSSDSGLLTEMLGLVYSTKIEILVVPYQNGKPRILYQTSDSGPPYQHYDAGLTYQNGKSVNLAKKRDSGVPYQNVRSGIL